jgi:hypothetical protein
VAVPAGPVELKAEPIDGARPTFSGSHEQIIDDIRVYETAGVTGMTVGFRARALQGHLEKLETFVDRDLLQYGEIWAAAGTPNAVFRLSPDGLVKMTGGRVVEVA